MTLQLCACFNFCGVNISEQICWVNWKCVFDFIRNCQPLSQTAFTIFLSHQQHECFGFSTPFPKLVLSVIKVKNKQRPTLKISRADNTSLVIQAELNLAYFAILTWIGSFLAYDSGNHKEILHCFSRLIWGNPWKFYYNQSLKRMKVTVFSLYKQ